MGDDAKVNDKIEEMINGIRRNGFQGWCARQTRRAVNKERILLALQLQGPRLHNDLVELLGLSVQAVASYLHEMHEEGLIRPQPDRFIIHPTSHRKSHYWEALRPSHWRPEEPTPPQPIKKRRSRKALKRIEQDEALGIGLTEQDMAYHHYWSLPRAERLRIPPPPVPEVMT